MKTRTFLKLALFTALVGYVTALPTESGHHEHHLVHRALPTVTQMKTVTVRDDDTVVFVDARGVPVQTVKRSATPAPAAIRVPPQKNPVSAGIQTRQADAPAPAATGALKGFSVAYDPIEPNNGCRDFDKDFGMLAQQGVGMIRVFDVACPLNDAVTAAAKFNLKLMLGVNDINGGAFPDNLNKLIGMVNSAPAKWGPVDTVYVCNECVNNGIEKNQGSPAELAKGVSEAVTTGRGLLQGAGFTGSVITVEAFNRMEDDATICSTSDYCGANIHPYFNPNFTSDQAGKFVSDSLGLTKNANPGKRVLVTEAGWPHQGNPNGVAVASPNDQKIAINSIMGAFASTPADLFLFQSFDAIYKTPGDLGIEQFFGIFNSDTGAFLS